MAAGRGTHDGACLWTLHTLQVHAPCKSTTEKWV